MSTTIQLAFAVGEPADRRADGPARVSLADAVAVAAAAGEAGIAAIRLLDDAGGRRALDPTVVSAYLAGLHGGVGTVRARHLAVADITCEIVPVGNGATQLAVVPEQDGSKALNQIATFVSPVTGRVHVDCAGLPAVFVDNADDAGTDRAGLALLLASAALAVGLPLLLGAFYRPRPRED